MVLLKKCLSISLLTGLVSASNYTKYVSLSNQNYEIQRTSLLHYYPFTVKSNVCVGSCNTVNDLLFSDIAISANIYNKWIIAAVKVLIYDKFF